MLNTNINIKNLLIVINPIAPHISEELWNKLGEKDTINNNGWPKYKKIKEKQIYKIIIQVNSKTKYILETYNINNTQHIKYTSIKSKKVNEIIQNKKIKRLIIKQKIINIVL
jgi:leucyl-tRNA synthetase